MVRHAEPPAPSEKTRLSITFPASDYKEMEQIAAKQRVSVAWVVRDAVADYLSARNPLFLANKGAHQLENSSR